MSSHLIRSDLVPILGGYLILMAVLAVGLRAQRRRAAAGLPVSRLTGRRDHGWRALILHVLTDALAGYLLLAAVVVLYYYGVARVASNFLDSEFTGSAALLGISLPLFLALSWLTERRRRARPPGAGGRRPSQPVKPRRADRGRARGGQAAPGTRALSSERAQRAAIVVSWRPMRTRTHHDPGREA